MEKTDILGKSLGRKINKFDYKCNVKTKLVSAQRIFENDEEAEKHNLPTLLNHIL